MSDDPCVWWKAATGCLVELLIVLVIVHFAMIHAAYKINKEDVLLERYACNDLVLNMAMKCDFSTPAGQEASAMLLKASDLISLRGSPKPKVPSPN